MERDEIEKKMNAPVVFKQPSDPQKDDLAARVDEALRTSEHHG